MPMITLLFSTDYARATLLLLLMTLCAPGCCVTRIIISPLRFRHALQRYYAIIITITTPLLLPLHAFQRYTLLIISLAFHYAIFRHYAIITPRYYYYYDIIVFHYYWWCHYYYADDWCWYYLIIDIIIFSLYWYYATLLLFSSAMAQRYAAAAMLPARYDFIIDIYLILFIRLYMLRCFCRARRCRHATLQRCYDMALRWCCASRIISCRLLCRLLSPLFRCVAAIDYCAIDITFDTLLIRLYARARNTLICCLLQEAADYASFASALPPPPIFHTPLSCYAYDARYEMPLRFRRRADYTLFSLMTLLLRYWWYYARADHFDISPLPPKACYAERRHAAVAGADDIIIISSFAAIRCAYTSCLCFTLDIAWWLLAPLPPPIAYASADILQDSHAQDDADAEISIRRWLLILMMLIRWWRYDIRWWICGVRWDIRATRASRQPCYASAASELAMPLLLLRRYTPAALRAAAAR